MKKFYRGFLDQNGDDLPVLTPMGTEDFEVSLQQAAVEVEPNVFVSEPGRFFFDSEGNFAEKKVQVYFGNSINPGGGYPTSGIWVDYVAYAPDRLYFVTLNDSGTPANELLRNTPVLIIIEAPDPE